MSESRVLAEVEAACMRYRICVLPRNPKILYCSVWDMPDPNFHAGVIWRQNVGVAKYGRQSVRFGMPGAADFDGWLFGVGRRIEIEAKTQKGVLSDAQASHGRIAQLTGCLWALVRSYDETCEVLEKWGLKANA